MQVKGRPEFLLCNISEGCREQNVPKPSRELELEQTKDFFFFNGDSSNGQNTRNGSVLGNESRQNSGSRVVMSIIDGGTAGG